MKQKVALITGGTAGIGRKTALTLAAEGYRVMIAGRSRESGEHLAHEIILKGGEAAYICTDVSVEKEVIRMVESAVDQYGSIDYLFNNAGTEGVLGPVETNSETVIDTVLAANIKGVILCIKHILPLMRQQKSGVIVNTASFVGTTMPLPVAVVYGASKSAVLSITQSVAASCAEDNIRVYAVCPWVTDTPMADRLTGHNEEAKAAFGANINPGGAIVPVEEIVEAVVRLVEGTDAINSGEAVLIDKNRVFNLINPMTVGDLVKL
ncbi:SDR family NAD(P)-dependent oxidoreductase [uncultured Chryseobacterium sp.]|uniref:SDR family NAD(P)-dependent oxidoreductase n=1 Tax=uncultured Chryseobacterium sp. TaxID=259322 RepID=UPI0025F4150F|nr:SDR family NAD(P)-dependent oxidoreductase [uncultured Chryseobacterium sp.]